ncbi:MAG: methylornithine synthase PylB [Thermacetogeniaceae bacterium]
MNAKLEHIFEKANRLEQLSSEEVEYLLGLNEKDADALFEFARYLRERFFGKKVFLYGFVYFSTWCRNDCTFCYYRRSNIESIRYRKTKEEVLDAAYRLAESGVHLIDLTLGEDPLFYDHHGGFEILIDLVEELKRRIRLPIMISPGVVPEYVLKEFAIAGADWYACYQETHNERLFQELRVNQSYKQRLINKIKALKYGLLIEEGILAGIGESSSDIVVSTQYMRQLGAHQVRVMSFIPQKGTPLEKWPTPSRLWELKIIAVLRLLFPDRLIPASLDIDGVAGLQKRINAGANVITSLIPPQLGLAGVAQSTKDIDEGYRTVQGILPLLEKMNLSPAELEDYQRWVNCAKDQIKNNKRGACP